MPGESWRWGAKVFGSEAAVKACMDVINAVGM